MKNGCETTYIFRCCFHSCLSALVSFSILENIPFVRISAIFIHFAEFRVDVIKVEKKYDKNVQKVCVGKKAQMGQKN